MEYLYKIGRDCCGENTPEFENITKDNWISERNKFLRNVSYNGERTHLKVIEILQWFNQFLSNEEV